MSKFLLLKLQRWNTFYRNVPALVMPPFPSVRNGIPARNLSSQIVNHPSEDGIIKRIKKRLYDSFSDVSKINIGACLAYENCVDTIDWNQFNNYFKQADTFNSWFLAVQLHIWMIIATTIAEKNGRVFRNRLVEEMWNDVELRLKNLGEVKSSLKKECLTEMLDQFQAALVSYDEGVLDDDKTLAASIWRTFFAFDKNLDPKLLEASVFYVRKQIFHLNSLNCQEIMFRGSISFLPLDDIIADLEKTENL